MIHPHLAFLSSMLVWLLTVLIASAAWLYFRSTGRSIAEAGVSALMITHIAVCLVIQIAVILGRIWPAILTSVAAAGVAATLIWRLRFWAGQTWRIVFDFSRIYPLPVGIAVSAVCFRGMWAAFGPDAGFFLSPAAEIESLASVNIAYLLNSQTTLWIHTYHFLAGILAYVAIGLSTYALSRRHAWPPAALTATLVVLSMPRLANPLLAPVSELITTAAALFVLKALYRAIECLRFDDLLMLVLGLSYTWSIHPMGWILPSILIFLTLLLIHRRHGWVHLAHLVRDRPWLTATASGVAVLMSPAWNHSLGFIGRDSHLIIRYNTDGLSGAGANLLRYVLQVVQANPSAHFWAKPISLWWQGLLEGVYQNAIHLLGGNLGAVARFNLSTGAGFGPLSLILVLPAVGYALIQGPRRLRAVAITIGWYWFLLVLIPAWRPANIQLLTPLMAISGFTVAFFLPPWRFSRTGQFTLNLICLLSLFTAF
jgi:hypothetical protein